MSRRTGGVVLHTDRVNWEPLAVLNSQGFAWIKTLSKDAATGARTAMIRYEPGFRAPASVSSWAMDTYTLEGEMTSGDLTFNEDTYHYRPAGTTIGPIESKQGITRIIFTADSQDPAKSTADEVFVQNVRTDVAPNQSLASLPEVAKETFGAFAEAAAPAAPMFDTGHISPDPSAPVVESTGDLKWRKILRLDPLAEIAFRVQRVAKVGIRDAVNVVHIHPWIEEAYMITGENQDYDSAIDAHWHWSAGTYVCRPPKECLHGDALKLSDTYYMIVRSGWTSDPKQAAEWKAWQDATEVPLEPVTFTE